MIMSWIKWICFGPCNVSVMLPCLPVREKETEKVGRKYANFKAVMGAPFFFMNRKAVAILILRKTSLPL